MMINNGVLSSLMRGNGGDVSALSSSGSRSNKNSDSAGNGMENIVEGGMSSQPLASSANRASVPTPKKRGHPGSPDADTEVIALSPKSLMAKNRFMCEICNKGFQRDQNLQLHRRGHNLPWKLKQRSNRDAVKKKVYICPETTCAHHDPSRALGDLTGVKKHFSRKHGEKKWKCEKCTKRYAVQSDWKAHSKICGTREYKCDCGTVFSRRDSFTTHRAFCDALSHENPSMSTLFLQKIPLNTSTDSLQHISSSSCNFQPHSFSIKTEQENLHDLFIPTQQEIRVSSNTILDPSFIQQTNPKTTLFQQGATVPHMSATTIIERAMSKPLPSYLNPLMLSQHHQIGFESGAIIGSSTGMFSSSCGQDRLAAVAGGSSFFSHSGFEDFEREALASDHAATCDYRTRLAVDQGGKSTGIESPMPQNFHLDHNRIMTMHHPRNNIDMPSTQQADQLYEYFCNNIESTMIHGMTNSAVGNQREGDFQDKVEVDHRILNGRSDDQGTTRDFLGLKALSTVHEGPVKVAGFDFVISPSTSTTNYKSRTNNNHDDEEELH